jgi:alpha-tubulin suppressor-like RCC1 family protein
MGIGSSDCARNRRSTTAFPPFHWFVYTSRSAAGIMERPTLTRASRTALAGVVVLLSAPPLIVACRNPSVDGFPASFDQKCPPGFSIHDGKCFRNPGIAGHDGAASSASRDAAMAGSPGQRWDAATGSPGDGPVPRLPDAAGLTDAGGDQTAAPSPPPDAGLPLCSPGACLRASKVATGYEFTCAILMNGSVACWGLNRDGQLGQSSVPYSARPIAVPGVNGATAIAAGYSHACAVVGGGSVRCWGGNSAGQLGSSLGTAGGPFTVTDLGSATAIAAGGRHSCVIVAGGSARCWGDNTSGQLGNDSLTGSAVPVPVANLSGVRALAAGEQHSCAVVGSGSVRCWGSNSWGQLGNGQTNTSLIPSELIGPTEAEAISTNNYQTCTTDRTGSLWCWGMLGSGLSAMPTTPRLIPGLVVDPIIAVGPYHVCAMVDAGSVQCWGSNLRGELGNGKNDAVAAPGDPVVGLKNPVSLAAGGAHSCAVASDGAVYCWGHNNWGQIGSETPDGPFLNSPFPRPVFLTGP